MMKIIFARIYLLIYPAIRRLLILLHLVVPLFACATVWDATQGHSSILRVVVLAVVGWITYQAFPFLKIPFVRLAIKSDLILDRAAQKGADSGSGSPKTNSNFDLSGYDNHARLTKICEEVRNRNQIDEEIICFVSDRPGEVSVHPALKEELDKPENQDALSVLLEMAKLPEPK